MTFIKLLALGAVSTLGLAGCGGGGDGSGSSTPPLAVSSLQGYWNPPSGTGNISGSAALGSNATRARAVVLEDGQVYLFLHDGSVAGEPLVGLATATAFGTPRGFTGDGKRYPASGAPVADIAISGVAPTPSGWNIDVSSTGLSSTVSLASNAAYNTPAVQSDVVGTWDFTKSGGTITAAWTVNGAGALSGTSSLGCTYTGTVQPRNATTAVFGVSITETCTGTVKQLTGIARLNTAKDFLTFGLTTANGAEAEAFAAAKR